jgi:hypothetical protein
MCPVRCVTYVSGRSRFSRSSPETRRKFPCSCELVSLGFTGSYQQVQRNINAAIANWECSVRERVQTVESKERRRAP